MNRFVIFFIVMGVLGLGIVIGGFLFSDSMPRQFILVGDCGQQCFKQSELAGLLTSVGIQNLGGKLPYVVYETDKTLVFDIQYPYPKDKIHYLVVPKKDVQDVAQLTHEDQEYLYDSYAVMGKIIRDNNYTKYRVITNGSGFQEVAYLHFHLVIDRDQE